MYSQPETATHTIKKIIDCMHADGYLFLGHAEGNMAPRDTLTPVACCDTFIFQKKGLNKKQEKTAAGVNMPAHKKLSDFQIKRRIEPRMETDHSEDRVDMKTDHYREALRHYYQDDFEQALLALKKDAADSQEDLRSLVLTGLIYYNMEDLDLAEQYRRKAYGISSIAAEVHALEAMIKEAQGDPDGAVKANRNAIFLDKCLFAPHLSLCRIYEKTGDTVKARGHYNNALKLLEYDDMERVNLFCGPVSKKMLTEICGRTGVKGRDEYAFVQYP
jgi:tetratricopeptide (TPR) repeat protein